MFKFITHRPFWVNLLAVLFLAFLIVFIFLQLLGVITKHGQYLTVPSVLGKESKAAVTLLESKGFEVVIQDSVYTDTATMGTVLKQLPDPNSTVKVNRTVFLTINRVTLPMIDMPALKGKTINFAIEVLKRSHLVLGDTSYKPDFMRGSVLTQSYKGKEIESGTKIPWGSSVDLVIGGGQNQEFMNMPSLLGLTLTEAKIVIEQNSLSLGAIIVKPGITDTANAYIYQQSPPKLNNDKTPVHVQSGQIVDLWLSKEREIPVDSANTD